MSVCSAYFCDKTRIKSIFLLKKFTVDRLSKKLNEENSAAINQRQAIEKSLRLLKMIADYLQISEAFKLRK